MKIASSQVQMSNDHNSDWASARIVEDVATPRKGQSNSATDVDLSDEALATIRRQVQNGEGLNLPNAQQSGNRRQQMLFEAGSESFTSQKSLSSTTNQAGNLAAIQETAVLEKSVSVMKLIIERMAQESGTASSIDNVGQTAAALQQSRMSSQNLTIGFIPGQGPQQGLSADFMASLNGMQNQDPGQNQGQSDFVRVTQYQYEKQSNFVEFSGSIERENGDSINFSMAVGFSQEYEKLSTEVINREELKDPLVISFSTKPVALSNEKMSFDIDADGQEDEIAQLKQGFGFLALDKNGDNKINDGSELFGALSGNGFADLAQYDDDQNGYIDENDAVFEQLSVWVKNEGEDKMVSLKDAGIGAIATQHVDSPMNIRDAESGDKLGVIQKSGYYLNEDGKAGLIQQMDFVV